jgi:hypothetical protein
MIWAIAPPAFAGFLRKALNLGHPLGLLWTIVVLLGLIALAVLDALISH